MRPQARHKHGEDVAESPNVVVQHVRGPQESHGSAHVIPDVITCINKYSFLPNHKYKHVVITLDVNQGRFCDDLPGQPDLEVLRQRDPPLPDPAVEWGHALPDAERGRRLRD